MNFLDFYSQHFVSVTIILFVVLILIGCFIWFIIANTKDKSVKTPWFEIGAESVKIPESMESNRTRLLLSRQMDYVDKYIEGLHPVFLGVERNVVEQAMAILFKETHAPKTHMQTCLIQFSTEELMKELKNYINKLLVMNHIGTDKEKIRKYVNGHINPVMGIVRKHFCELYCKLSGDICVNTTEFWKKIEINNPEEWCEEKLTELFLDLSDLRYSDFDANNLKIKEEKNKK